MLFAAAAPPGPAPIIATSSNSSSSMTGNQVTGNLATTQPPQHLLERLPELLPEYICQRQPYINQVVS
jgi:hypothetical protein